MDSPDIGPLPALVYILSSFVANAGVAITGFGMALIFVFVYTIFDVFGGMADCQPSELCDMKYAVFIQSLSLVGSMPFLIYKSNARTHANKRLLYTLIPITLVSTPAGQMCQDFVASSWIRMVVGVVVSAVVGYEIHKLYKKRQVDEPAAIIIENSSTPTERTSLLIREANSSLGSETDDNQDGLHGFSPKSILLWGVVLGFFSGFLGGLIGMRGPPLMIFFLHFSFPKQEARAVGAILLFLNMALRVSYYLLQDYQESAATSIRWFYWGTSWHLYVGVIVAGIVGVPLGDWVHHRIDQSKFRLALAILLAASGVVNILKAISELQQQ